ncbi:hypothetical protein AGMMS49579_03740 [Spirochaetia bacterium]|nr:hypothetical protein AGMMS49579_03740 [Spirochaetia bacterium]
MFNVDNPYLKFAWILDNLIFDDNAGPADNVIWSSKKINSITGTSNPATPSTLGIIQLAGDLSGTATNPIIAIGAINNNKLANMANPSMLKGSSSTSNATTDITLGNGLTMNGTTLTVDTTTIQKAGTSQFGLIEFNNIGNLQDSGTNSGIAVITNNSIKNNQLSNMNSTSMLLGSSSNSNNITNIILGSGLIIIDNTLYLNTNTIQKAGQTQFGLVKFDILGDLEETFTNSGIASISPKKITLSKMANLPNISQLLGSSSLNSAVTNILLGNSLNIVNNILSINVNNIDTLPVSKGGTGSVSFGNNFLYSNNSNNVLIVTNIPVSNVIGAVTSVNGITPDSNGNVNITYGSVSSGIYSNLPQQPQPNGNIYIIENDPNITNGTTYISDGNNWNLVIPNEASFDARYINKAGDTLGGNLIFPSGTDLILQYTPTNSNDAVNKAYVDQRISSAVPQATTTTVGTIQLAGVLGGTATSPTLNNNSVTNMALSNLSNSSMLKGSSSSSNNITDISLGQGLDINNSTLNIDITAFNKAGSNQFGIVEFDDSGDLTDSGTNTGIAIVQPGVVTNSILANMSSTSMLKGSNSTSTNVIDLSLGQDLSITGNTLNIVTQKAGNAQFGTIEFDPSGDLTDVNGSNANSGIAVVKPGSITTSKLANLPGPSQLIGSSSTSSNPTNLNTNLIEVNNTLNSNVSFTTGNDPNITAPVYLPKTPNVLYVGNDGSYYTWNGTSYINISDNSGSKLNTIQSNTIYVIPMNGNSNPVHMTDYNLTVPAGTNVKINYVLNFQSTQPLNYAPSISVSGVRITDIFQFSIIGFFASAARPSSFSVAYNLTKAYELGNTDSAAYTYANINADNNLLATTNYNSSQLMNLNDQAIPVHIIAYYQNLGSSSITLTLFANVDSKGPSNYMQFINGYMDYIFY